MNLLGMYLGYQMIEGVLEGILIGIFAPVEEQITMPKLGEIFKGSIR